MTSYYQGTKGVIARSGHYLVYSYPASTVLAPTPVTSYSNGAISGLVANRKYLLTDSNGTKHYVTADSNGKIIISSTSNRDLAGLSITSLVTLRSSSEGSSETADSNAETVSYTLPSMQSTPASTFASASKISSLTPNETYELTDSKGNTHLVKANASGEIVLDDSTNRDLAGLTIKSIVHKGDDKKTIDSEQQLVSYTFKDKEITPTSSYDTNAITDLTPNTTYVLKDSNGNTHSVTSNASGQIVVDDNNNVSLAGLTIVGIAKVAGSSTICSDEQSVRYVLPSQYETPTSTFANNTISGLVAGETYVLTYNGGSKEVVADSNGKIVMDDSTNRDLAGLTITSLVHKTSNNHLSSPAQSGLSYNFGNKEVISPTPTYTTNTISGLVGGESYTLIDSDGVKHVVSATSDGKIVVDDTTNRDLAGLSIASIVKNGESGSISSDPTIFATPLVLPSKVATPSTTYDPDSKVISGLVVGQEYVFTFDDNTTYKFTATDTTFSVSDTSNRDLAGKTITKIVASGNGGSLICSDSQTVDDLLASKEVLEPLTLSYDQSQDTISGLKATTSYRLYYEGGYVDVTSDKDGKCDLSDYSELVGKTITSIAKVGSGSNVVSDPQVIDNYVVNKREEIPSTFKQEENGVLSGLKPGTAYILKDLNGNSYEVTSDKDGKINTYDIVGEDGLKIAGKTTLSSIEAVGDSSIPSINSKVKVLTSNIVIPTREVVGEISFDSTYGVLSGFKANEEYEITYTDSTGTLKKETIKANELGEINVLEHPELATSTISQVTKLGVVSKGTIDSQDKALSITIGTLETYASSTKSKAKSDLEKALKAIVSSSSVTDKDKVTDKVNPIISKAQEEIDKLTNDETLVSKVADIIEEAKKEAEFEVKREQGIETVTNLKRKCSDNDKINKAVDDAINDLNDLTYSTTSSSEVDTIVSKATDKVNLVIKQISLTNDVSSSFGDNPSSDEQALIDEYTKKIEGATSEEEAASIYKEFINAKTKLLNDKSSSKANGLMIACFVLFGIYLLFYVIYALLLKHHEFDGVHVVTMILYSVFLIIMSCLIKSNPGFIALGLSWFILASALGLTSYFTYKANKASKQDEASKHA
jgi:hypothetical protein